MYNIEHCPGYMLEAFTGSAVSSGGYELLQPLLSSLIFFCLLINLLISYSASSFSSLFVLILYAMSDISI